MLSATKPTSVRVSLTAMRLRTNASGPVIGGIIAPRRPPRVRQLVRLTIFSWLGIPNPAFPHSAPQEAAMRRLVTMSLLLAACSTLALVPTADAQSKPVEIPITVENQKFTPAEVKVKAGQPFALVVTNKDAKAAGVESKAPRVEKVAPPGKTGSIRVRALKPGTYVFVDDFNKSNQGKIVAE